MDLLLARIQKLVADDRVRVSSHGFEELTNDDISLSEVLNGLPAAISIEEYPDYHKGPCVLVLQTLGDGSVGHILWASRRILLKPRPLSPATAPIPSDGPRIS